ncbi:hypothetical protein J4476_06000 [Candidatus Woesearchaeota archaeon]|nr:hypothetical protein [Candidatus Woesearchaeota archaeon]HIH25548.1 hypothetical protein [Nanoarchaeota archaeon]
MNNNLKNALINYSGKDRIKQIKFPKYMNSLLAEEIGIHIGDGFLSLEKSDFRVKGHKIDERDYYNNHIKDLYKKLYNINVNLKDYEDTYGFELYSKAIKSFKTKVLGIKAGKKDNITVPQIISNNNDNIKIAFLRGLFDTDCNLYFSPKNGKTNHYPVLSLYQSSRELIFEINRMLINLNFNTRVYQDHRYEGWTICLYGYNNLFKFIKVIGFNNRKHLIKFELWKQNFPNLYKKWRG